MHAEIGNVYSFNADSSGAVVGDGEARVMSLEDSASSFKREIRATPWNVEMPWRLKVAEIAAGHCFSAVITTDGLLFTWGYVLLLSRSQLSDDEEGASVPTSGRR